MPAYADYIRESDRGMREITELDFDSEVLKCELPVFTCFVARWSHSCYPTCLFAHELTKQYDGRVKFVRVDVDKSPELAAGYGVIAMPTILLFQDSHPVKKLLGFQDRNSLRRLLDSAIAD